MNKNTKIKPEPSGIEDDMYIFGYYFRSNSHYQEYLVNVEITEVFVSGVNEMCQKCKCKIYELDPHWTDLNEKEALKSLQIGSLIGVFDNYVELIAEIDISSKYYFLTTHFKRKQMYYDSKKYYNEPNSNDDELAAIKDVLDFAIEVGLRDSETKPY